MAEDQAGGVSAGDESTLPRVRVLSYMAQVESSTQVRVVTSRVLMVLGTLCELLALGVIAVGVFVYWNTVGEWFLYRGAASWGWVHISGTLLLDEGGWCWLLVAGYLFGGGLSHLLFSRPVRRGSKAACRISCLVLVPALLGWLFISAMCGVMGILNGVGYGEPHWSMLGLIWFAWMACGIIASLLLFDLFAYLSWIAKNPITEKAAVPFLPPRGSGN